jgi:hypothetical protein
MMRNLRPGESDELALGPKTRALEKLKHAHFHVFSTIAPHPYGKALYFSPDLQQCHKMKSLKPSASYLVQSLGPVLEGHKL